MAANESSPFHTVDVREAVELMPTGLFLLTAAHDGQDNWQFVQRGLGLNAGPPATLLVVLSHRNRTTELVDASGEFGLAICSPRQAEIVIGSRGVSGHAVDDKFAQFGLERLPAQHIKAPLIADSFANMECRVIDTHSLGDRSVYVAEVLAMYHNPAAEPTVHYVRKIYRFLQDPPIG
jgi:flavin reductase (DIM6/NTAB) family NADH-FMN oxidoreductase RutF